MRCSPGRFKTIASTINWSVDSTRSGRAAIRRAAIHSVVLCLCVSLMPGYSSGSSDNPFLLSSSVSPDGVWIAENFGTDGCCNGGFVLIRRTSEPSSPGDASIFSASTAPGLFMIWRDDKTLSLAQDSNDAPVTGPSTYKEITILYATYRNRINDDHTFDVANVSKKSLNIKETEVSAATAEEATKTGRRCRFSLSASEGTIYDQIGLRFEANINRCNRVRDCAGISSEFWIGKRVDGQPGVALTSATVSDIPSYNRLPEGDRNGAVRGGFGEGSAIDLVTALSSAALDIQYSLNFFDTILSYRFQTRQIATSVQSFKSCIGDGDFNWAVHEATKPGFPTNSRK